MKFYCANLIYDTDKSELIFETGKYRSIDGLFFSYKYYKTKNNKFFELKIYYKTRSKSIKDGSLLSKLGLKRELEYYEVDLDSYFILVTASCVIRKLIEHGNFQKANELADKYCKEA